MRLIGQRQWSETDLGVLRHMAASGEGLGLIAKVMCRLPSAIAAKARELRIEIAT